MPHAQCAAADNTLPAGRFAPSPTGRMHLGNIYAALMSFLSARQKGGRWFLRIEDIDTQRSRSEYATQIMRDLEWLGLNWDGEPVFQSRRSDIYLHYLRELSDRGLLYPCSCTRAALMAASAPHASDGLHPYTGTCRPTTPCFDAADMQQTLRLRIDDDATVTFRDTIHGQMAVKPSQTTGDFVVRRRDGTWAYQFAVAIDDSLMGITDVVRGDDLLLSTAPQRYLQQLLGLPLPQTYTHIPLLTNEQGVRLSKRDASLSMEELQKVHTPQSLIADICLKAGLDIDKTLSLTNL